MQCKALVLGICMAIVGTGGNALAATGTINYQIGSGSVVPVTSEQDFSINVGTISGTVVLRIWDPSLGSGVPDDGVGKVTINGSWSSGGELRILIAGTSESWPDPTDLMTNPGLRDLGLNSGDGIEITDSDLRKHTRLAAYVSGDIHGTIEVGQVQRIQAGNLNPFVVTGTIHANISAIAPYSQFTQDSIGRIYAGNAIIGNLIATGDGSFDPADTGTYASIGRIVIGPATAAAGILGDIKAEKGAIGEIYTTGPIGSETVTPAIHAARGINEIRAVSESALGTVLARDFHADIKAGLDIGTPLVVPIDAPLHLIETQGDLTGSVEVANIAWDAPAGGRQWGILVGGAITAPITIKYNLEIADIIAASIDAPITIGVSAKGAIVATDPLGQILSIEVGYANEGLDEEDEGWDPIAAAYDVEFPRGFKGSACRPVDPHFAAPFDAYTREDWTSAVVHCFEGTIDEGPFDSGSTDSVIRAPYIGSVRLATMTNFYRWSSTKSYFPRVESPEIGVLEIGILHAGVVWSGNLYSVEGMGGWAMAWDSEDAYSSVGEIRIGCITGGGDLWVDGTTRVQIDGDMLGQVHVPTLTNTIWIGGRLGLWSVFGTSCAAIGLGSYATSSASTEDSPRDSTWTGEDTAARGEIVIRELGGLQGQIIINGRNDGGTWDGVVVVGDELGYGDRIVITPDDGDDEFDPDFHAPHYLSPSGRLGGGAVGLAPFAFYPTDCNPPHNHIRGVWWEAFANCAVPVFARWYGPVEFADDETFETLSDLLNLHCLNPNTIEVCQWLGLESMFNFVKHPGGHSRSIGVKAGCGAVPKDGLYRISYEAPGVARLVSADVHGTPLVGLFPQGCENDADGYRFRVDADCDNNDLPDWEEIFNNNALDANGNGVLDECEGLATCAADWDENGVIGVNDIFEFLAAWFAACDGSQGCGDPPTGPCYCKSADYNCANGIDVADIFAFLTDWFALGPNASCP